MVNRFSLITIAVLLFCIATVTVFAKKTADKFGFLNLKDKEVWIADENGKAIVQVTKTGGKVDNFLFSPSLQYIAYDKILRFTDEPGIWGPGEVIPQRPEYSVEILRVKDRKVVQEIVPTGNDSSSYYYLWNWLSNEKVSIGVSSGFDLEGFIVYDIRKCSRTRTNEEIGIKSLVDDYMQYIGDDKLDIIMSHDKKHIAFFRVDWNHSSGTGTDNVLILNTEDKSVHQIYSGPSKSKAAGEQVIQWSFDDKYIGLFHQEDKIIINTEKPEETTRFNGDTPIWIGNKEILYAKGSNIYKFDVTTNKEKIFIENASKPVYLDPGSEIPKKSGN